MKQITPDLADEIRAAHYEKTGRIWLTAGTSSMEPLIKPGDRVLMCSVAPGDIRRSDIIVFRRDGCLIGHRVLRKKTTGDHLCFVEKGDNSDILGLFHEHDVIGKVIAIEGRNRFLYLDTLPGRILDGILLVWFSCISAVHDKLSMSGFKPLKKLGSGLDRVFRFVSRSFVGMSCFVLFRAGHTQNERHV